MKSIYLILSVLGGILPYIYFLSFFSEPGVSLTKFSQALFANGAAGGFSADLLFSSFVFWIFLYQQNRSQKGINPFPFIGLNLFVGLSCALPAYYFALEVRKEKE